MFAELPKDLLIGGGEFRERIFSGAIYKPRSQGGAEPARVARRWLSKACGPLDQLSRRWRAQDWPSVHRLQKEFSESAEVQNAVRTFLLGLNLGRRVLVGEARLRVVFPDGHLVPRAAPAYLPHRDTWFANSQAQINWWMPLLPVIESTSFGFCPEYFDRPVDNNSARFDYEKWSESGGFQHGGNSGREYPSTPVPLAPKRFRCEQDEYLCFSAAHLHQTMQVKGDRTRISLDFRTVSPSDVEEKRGAPNVDNASIGNATEDYQMAASRAWSLDRTGSKVGE